MPNNTIATNLDTIRAHIKLICQNCKRDPQSVKLVAVSKRFPAESIVTAQQANQTLFGENYIQEAHDKYSHLNGDVQIHFIGHLQSNKAKIAANICTMVETVDSIKLASLLNKSLEHLDKTLDILVQVNIGEDINKSGITPEEAPHLLTEIARLPMLKLRGLMLIPPYSDNPEDSRPHFRELFKLAQSLKSQNLFYNNENIELSMGMSHDYHIAIEEGATLVRIGTAIFGQRN